MRVLSTLSRLNCYVDEVSIFRIDAYQKNYFFFFLSFSA